MSFSQTIIIGNIGQEPEIRYSPSGDAIANISVAVSEKWKNKQGEQQESTEWFRCAAFRKTAELIGQYLHKGDPVMFIGKMKTRKWQDKDGNDRYSTELIVDRMNFIGGRSGRNQQQPSSQQASQDFQSEGGFDDSIPF